MGSLDLFAGLPEEELPVLMGLVDGLDLSPLDCLTVRDLLQLTGLRSDPALFAVLAVMFSLTAEGSLCLDVSAGSLTARLTPGCDHENARRLAERFGHRLAAGRYEALIAVDSDAYLPLVLVRHKGGDLLYFHRFFRHEKNLEQGVHSFLSGSRMTLVEPAEVIVDRLFSAPLCLRRSAEGEPLEKDPQQAQALKDCLENRFTIISGGPGTGKTSLLANLVRALVRTGVSPERIFLGAPTGRAAQRMTEALQHYLGTIRQPAECDRALASLCGSTLHKMLGYRPGRNDFRYNAANLLPAEAVVLDEASMVDVIMMDHFLQAVDSRSTRLVLLGDRNQLPSVEAGAVFASMFPGKDRSHPFRDHMVLLEKVYRSGRRLAELAASLNAGRVPDGEPVSLKKALEMPDDSWCRVAFRGLGFWQQDQSCWLQAQYLRSRPGGKPSFRDTVGRAAGRSQSELTGSEEGRALLARLFRHTDGCRILTLVRRGPFGCETVNRHLAAEMSLAVEGAAAMPGGLFSGALVLITRNDYGQQLFNGDLGVALRDHEGLCRVYFQRAGAFAGFTRQQLPAWEFGYAVTVHKSQGSEFDDVLLVLPGEEEHRLLSREIVYTGVTRARRRVIIYGARRVLEQATRRKIERTSGLVWQ
jgi:exodeoxyribonuclease V alpha subunit